MILIQAFNTNPNCSNIFFFTPKELPNNQILCLIICYDANLGTSATE